IELAVRGDQLGRLETGLVALRAAVTETGNRLSALAEQRNAAADEAEAARDRATAHRAALLSQLDGAPDLDTALAAATGLADALAAAARAAEAVTAATTAAQTAEAEAAQAAADAGFPDVAAAQ